jgi:Holliday junction resolvase
MVINVKDKGNRFERDCAKEINKVSPDANVKRTPSSGGMDFKGDIIVINNKSIFSEWCFECKNQKNISMPSWIKQSERDCPVGKQAIIIYNYKGQKRVDLKFNDWLGLMMTIEHLEKELKKAVEGR